MHIKVKLNKSKNKYTDINTNKFRHLANIYSKLSPE